MLSASNMPTPNGTTDYSEPTVVLLLPAFVIVSHVTPASVPTLIAEIINKAPTNSGPRGGAPSSSSSSSAHAALPHLPFIVPLPQSVPGSPSPLSVSRCPHAALVLLCSQRTRDARCGQSAPLLRRELERHLRPLGLWRDPDDDRPGGVGVYFISHVGGHKYSANMLVYRRRDAFGMDSVRRVDVADGGELVPEGCREAVEGAGRRPWRGGGPDKGSGGKEGEATGAGKEGEVAGGGEEWDGDVEASQCIWLARVKPDDVENIVRYTVLQGKVVKPQSQLRGGFDRDRGLRSW